MVNWESGLGHLAIVGCRLPTLGWGWAWNPVLVGLGLGGGCEGWASALRYSVMVGCGWVMYLGLRTPNTRHSKDPNANKEDQTKQNTSDRFEEVDKPNEKGDKNKCSLRDT